MGVRPIGVLSPYLAGPYFGSLISAIARVVRAAGGQVVAVQTAKPGEEYLESPTLVDVANVGWEQLAGFVTIRKAVPPAYAEALREAGKPMVAIADPGPGQSCPVVLTDNRGGVSQAVEHLLWHRHRRIAFAGCLEQFDIKQRYDAYRDTLLAHGIEPDPALFYEAPDNIESGGLDVARRMLAAGLPSTAVVAATDLNAVGIMAALRRAGRTVPQEQAIVGFDDMPGSEMLTPSLSTVSQNFDTLGALAAELLLRQLDGARLGQVSHVVAASYVKRESCGCPSDSVVQGPVESEPRSNYAYYDLRKALRDEYLVARDLLAHRQQHPRALQWLGRTGVSAAVLGFWHPALASELDRAPDNGFTVGEGAPVVDLGSPLGTGGLGSGVPDLGMPGPRAVGSGRAGASGRAKASSHGAPRGRHLQRFRQQAGARLRELRRLVVPAR